MLFHIHEVSTSKIQTYFTGIMGISLGTKTEWHQLMFLKTSYTSEIEIRCLKLFSLKSSLNRVKFKLDLKLDLNWVELPNHLECCLTKEINPHILVNLLL